MLRGYSFFEPFAETANGDTASFANGHIRVLETGFDQRPDLVNEWRHIFTASLDSNSKSEHSSTAGCRVRRGEVLDNKLPQGWEHLSRREFR